jgi:hypothetical protein
MQKGTAPYLKFAAGARWRRIWQKCTDEAPHSLCRDSPRARITYFTVGILGHRSGSPDSYSPTAPEPRDFKCEALVCQWHPRSFLRMPKPCDARESAICADICRSTLQQSGQAACSECDFLEKATAITPAGVHTPKDPTHTYAIAFTSMADGRSFEYTRSSRATPSRSFASAWLNRNSPYHQPAILHRVPCRYSTVSERGRSPKTSLGHS